MSGTSLGTAAASLLFVLGLVFALWYFLKRHSRLLSPALADLKVLGRISVDQKHQILILQRHATEWTILLGPNICQILDRKES